MGHYAKVVEGKVVNVIVAEPNFFNTFIDSSPGLWIQTSYNTHGGEHQLGGIPLRKNFAGIGWNYDIEADAFYEPSPFASWTLHPEKFIWEPPVPLPNDGLVYAWNEADRIWEQLSETE
jgi:hypothetical protein